MKITDAVEYGIECGDRLIYATNEQLQVAGLELLTKRERYICRGIMMAVVLLFSEPEKKSAVPS